MNCEIILPNKDLQEIKRGDMFEITEIGSNRYDRFIFLENGNCPQIPIQSNVRLELSAFNKLDSILIREGILSGTIERLPSGTKLIITQD